MGKKSLRIVLAMLVTSLAALVVNAAPSQASGYYRIETKYTYNGHPLCLQGNGNLASVTVAVCSTSSRQKWAYYELNGYAVLANVGYSPALALDAPALSGGTTVQTRAIQGNAHQGWLWDSLWSRGGNIYLEYNNSLCLQPTSVTPGAVVKIQPTTTINGIQSWNMYVW